MQNIAHLMENLKILRLVSLYADSALLTATLNVPSNTDQMLHGNLSMLQSKKYKWIKQELCFAKYLQLSEAGFGRKTQDKYD